MALGNNPQMMPQRFSNNMMMGGMPNMMGMNMGGNFNMSQGGMNPSMFPQISQDRTSG
jgi:hypothetical protein